ncbi:hypothetical protein ElyMa_006540100 [Elysia marginata]|uniref:Uncharacterized protein n=1 Tax=Elysia marginata TaxID=1093978 RepID=A0AAV4I9L9_9GAST|nr:hypothetical protein ElyMa_006540100 [Elysia marginata]
MVNQPNRCVLPCLMVVGYGNGNDGNDDNNDDDTYVICCDGGDDNDDETEMAIHFYVITTCIDAGVPMNIINHFCDCGHICVSKY